MARKKRKDEKEETYEWVPPEFDEKAFLEKDIEGTKSLMWTALLAVVFGAIAFAIGVAVGQDLATIGVIAIFGGAALLNKFYDLLKLDRESVDKKLLAGNIILFILLSLGVWILLMNEPFSA